MQEFNIDLAIANLKSEIAQHWKTALKSSPFLKKILTTPVERDLYLNYMKETYHYTKHNARNQAAVGVVHENIPDGYRKFCFEHAAEETGHENMALHDIVSVGGNAAEVVNATPLPATRALIDFLYNLAEAGNPYARLGYSFWAESVYEHIDPVLKKIKRDLNLKPKQMTFFVAHAEIDSDHAAEVEDMIRHCVKTEEDFKALEDGALQSLELTFQLLEDVYRTVS